MGPVLWLPDGVELKAGDFLGGPSLPLELTVGRGQICLPGGCSELGKAIPSVNREQLSFPDAFVGAGHPPLARASITVFVLSAEEGLAEAGCLFVKGTVEKPYYVNGIILGTAIVPSDSGPCKQRPLSGALCLDSLRWPLSELRILCSKPRRPH